ncbi:erythroblast NAD(P)(+)--arginine ADP-ribosyltransferase-like [Chamaea fasciata]|uniref:erythroblast NAD(P)(+)--arginine ADP-ribosyltransferase-like n=1 Tax=Chamaea fasciata TaxID=190680 RepID=UPI00336AAFF3
MAPMAHTLALLAMAVAIGTIKALSLDMAQESFDDQYLTCGEKLSEDLLQLQVSDFCNNDKFYKDWLNATAQWQKRGSIRESLTPDQAIALMAYTMNEMKLYDRFNKAVQRAGRSSWEYQKKFHFKSLHFLLTRALQTLRHTNDCKNVIRGVKNYHFNVNKGDKVRFGQFASTSLSEKVAQNYGKATMFKVYTCHGVDIQKFSMYPDEKEVLIPPFETFEVTGVSEEGNTIDLRSTGTTSNYECEWLKGGSLPRNSPRLGGLLLATVAMAVITRTL